MDKPYKVAGEKWEVPQADNNYHRNLMNKGWRTTLKPLNIDQPEGPSFTVRPTTVKFCSCASLFLHGLTWMPPTRAPPCITKPSWLP